MTMPPVSRPGQPGRPRRAGPVRRVGVVAAMLTLAVAGCSAGSPASSTPRRSKVNDITMTPAQAAAHAEKILQDTAHALTPRPRLETSSPGEAYGILNNTTACTDGPDASEMVVVSRGYWLRGITAGDYAAVGEQVLAYWKSLHWVITDSKGIGTSQPAITGVAPPYAFNVSMTWGAAADPGGQLSMGASSVCLWPHGAPSSGQ
jgi:hypothetical protein